MIGPRLCCWSCVKDTISADHKHSSQSAGASVCIEVVRFIYLFIYLFSSLVIPIIFTIPRIYLSHCQCGGCLCSIVWFTDDIGTCGGFKVLRGTLTSDLIIKIWNFNVTLLANLRDTVTWECLTYDVVLAYVPYYLQYNLCMGCFLVLQDRCWKRIWP